MLYTLAQLRLPLWFWLLVIATAILLYGYLLSRPQQPQQPSDQSGQGVEEKQPTTTPALKHRKDAERLLSQVDGLLERIESL